jgi:hypothetical protein
VIGCASSSRRDSLWLGYRFWLNGHAAVKGTLTGVLLVCRSARTGVIHAAVKGTLTGDLLACRGARTGVIHAAFLGLKKKKKWHLLMSMVSSGR